MKKTSLFVALLLFAVLAIGCAVAKQEPPMNQQKPSPPPAYSPPPAPVPSCKDKCQAAYDECYAICDEDPEDYYCDFGFCEDDYDDCVAKC